MHLEGHLCYIKDSQNIQTVFLVHNLNLERGGHTVLTTTARRHNWFLGDRALEAEPSQACVQLHAGTWGPAHDYTLRVDAGKAPRYPRPG